MSRAAAFARLDSPFDVLVIGGGATGLGAAVDAASRGYATVLVEAGDLAGATSSRSTKLVHGGVRYLQNGDVPLVREALRERARLLANAPHLVAELGFILPAYTWLDVPFYLAGLKAYDLLAARSNLPASRYLGPRETRARLPALRTERLRGSISYADAQFDDARLAVALARTAIEEGATVLNYARATGFLYENGRACGALVRDVETGRDYEIRARSVINATGIFIDELRRLDDRTARPLLEHSRGSHVVFPRETFPGTQALIIPKTIDGRVLFAIPWHDRVVVGTTDIAVGSASLDPTPTRAEIDYIVAEFNGYLARPVRRADALAAFGGLRPLVNRKNAGNTAKLSREHLIDVSPSGVVTIAGGKWTTYRKMAEDAVDAAAVPAGLRASPSRTAGLPLHGSPGPQASPGGRYASYGTDRAALVAIETADPTLREALDPRLPYTRAEVVFAVREELARTVEDVLARRTRASFLDAGAAAASAPEVAAIIARELARGDAWRDAEIARFRASLARDVASFADETVSALARSSG